MMRTKLILIALTILGFNQLLTAQENFKQNIRGQVIDKQTRIPLIGATIIIPGSDPLIGTTTDMDGYFLLSEVETGRVDIQISYIGYFPKTFQNLSLTTGKEIVLHVELEEQVLQAQEVVIVGAVDKTRPKNEMATVSARQFTIEESQRYAGVRNDVSRMAANYAGVNTANDAVNDIVIRGNTPNGLLFQLEGVPIPNPNHFGAIGVSGGPVSMLNNNVLSNSDFFTSAFPAQYGNAFSGVFDLSLRNGNYENHEFLGQIGFNGFEFNAEGPVNREKRSSYLAAYRYSTLGVLANMGVDFGTGTAIPYYQDFSLKVNLPTKKLGNFTVFAMGGFNHIDFQNSENEIDTENFYSEDLMDIYNKNDMAVFGVSHSYIYNDKTYSKFVLSANRSYSKTELDSISRDEAGNVLDVNRWRNVEATTYDIIGHFYLNRKINRKNNLRLGTRITHKMFDFFNERLYGNEFQPILNTKNETQLIEAYAEWNLKPSDRLSLSTGLHYQQLTLDNQNAIEPRIGIKWLVGSNKSINMGYGMHSQMIPIYAYYFTAEDNRTELPNTGLDFLKSHHFVLGYDWNITPKLRFKAEAYYQNIVDAVVEETPSTFSMLNANSTTFDFPDRMKNGGLGRNYGIEFTFEHFMQRGFYLLATTSIFSSEYQGSDEVWRSTAFDSKYVANLLTGKEFRIGHGKSNQKSEKWLVFDLKLTAAGGLRYTPVDIEKTIESIETVYDWDQAYSQQFDDYFRMDIRVGYRIDGLKISQEFAVDLQNVTNKENPLRQTYNVYTGEIKNINQLGFFPMVQYRIAF
jgi:hypothetical protein